MPQKLSDGKTIDFEIGDKPYTPSCDYLRTCNYTCKPYKEITEDDVIMDTYSESFIIMNSEKIIQKIRDAYKEKYFYKKDDLIKYINLNKVYPETIMYIPSFDHVYVVLVFRILNLTHGAHTPVQVRAVRGNL